MIKAITFIEALVVIAITVIASYFISPIFLQIQTGILLNQEIDNIRIFFYHVQSKAKYRKQSYSFTISQDKQNNQYCIIAIAKNGNKQTACNCLFLSSCNIQSDYHIYHNRSNKITLKSQSLYPNTFLDIDGNSARLGEKCLGLSIDNYQEVIQFNESGGMNVAQKNKRTKCR